MTGLFTCMGGCGRQLEPEEAIVTDGGIVCEPCQASIAKAADRRDSIDDAWRAVEATLPAGYRIAGVLIGDGEWSAVAEPIADGGALSQLANMVDGRGATPTQALRALVRALVERRANGTT